ncbi:MAG TPA: aminotransferase, partial [Rhodospirillales bacterium]|nr:aminotransferase [Rhodospirillales bacterium]
IGTRHGLKVLFDSAPAFGSRIDGRPIGGYGDAQIFSFHATKAFTTMEGGALTSNNQCIIDRARAIRNFGQVSGAQCDEAGINAKLTEVCALVGIEQLKHFDQVVERRAGVGNIYRRGLENIDGITLAHVSPGTISVWLYFPVILDPAGFGLNRDELVEALESENIFVRKYFELPCHHLDAYKSLKTGSLKDTEQAAYNVISLPVYNDMTDQEASVIVEAIQRIHAAAPEVKGALSKSKCA